MSDINQDDDTQEIIPVSDGDLYSDSYYMDEWYEKDDNYGDIVSGDECYNWDRWDDYYPPPPRFPLLQRAHVWLVLRRQSIRVWVNHKLLRRADPFDSIPF